MDFGYFAPVETNQLFNPNLVPGKRGGEADRHVGHTVEIRKSCDATDISPRRGPAREPRLREKPLVKCDADVVGTKPNAYPVVVYGRRWLICF